MSPPDQERAPQQRQQWAPQQRQQWAPQQRQQWAPQQRQQWARQRLFAFLEHPDWPGKARPLDGPADYATLRRLSAEAHIPVNLHRVYIGAGDWDETITPLEL